MFKFSLFFVVIIIGCSPNSKQVTQDNNISKKKEEVLHNNALQHTAPQLLKRIDFAGETYSLVDKDIRERLDRELVVNTFWHSNTIFYLKRAYRWFPILSKILKEEGIPDDFKYLAVAESGLKQATSLSGAKGFWQFMPKTALAYDLEISETVDERLNIEKSTVAACKYLKKAYQRLGSWSLAAAAYNRGSNGIERDLINQQVTHLFDAHLNNETARYFFRIMAIKEIMENPEKYNFNVTEENKYTPFKTKRVSIKEDIKDLSSWAKTNGFNLKILKKLNPWLISNRLTVKKGKSYVILLPTLEEKLKHYADY